MLAATPAAGLAPHFDDVEIFVVQTQGSKRWRVYCPTPEALPGSLLAHCRLANKPSGDLAEEEIGEPSMEVTLEVSSGGGGRGGAAAGGAAAES